MRVFAVFARMARWLNRNFVASPLEKSMHIVLAQAGTYSA